MASVALRKPSIWLGTYKQGHQLNGLEVSSAQLQRKSLSVSSAIYVPYFQVDHIASLAWRVRPVASAAFIHKGPQFCKACNLVLGASELWMAPGIVHRDSRHPRRHHEIDSPRVFIVHEDVRRGGHGISTGGQ